MLRHFFDAPLVGLPAFQLLRAQRRGLAGFEVMLDRAQPAALLARKLRLDVHDQAGHHLLLMLAADAAFFQAVKQPRTKRRALAPIPITPYISKNT